MNLPNQWTKKSYQKWICDLFQYQDLNYQKFNESLIPGVEKTIGIRMPILRLIAKDIQKTDITSFLHCVENTYLEETILEGLVIAGMKDVNKSLNYFTFYIKKINTWASCDIFCNNYKIVRKHPDIFYKIVKDYLSSKKTYEIRVAIVIMMCHFLNEKYIDDILESISSIKSDEYYVNMAIAWCLCECFIKYQEKTLPILENKKLNTFTHNKTIQKIIESNRVRKEEKDFIRTLK